MDKHDRRKVILYAVFALIFLIRMVKINNPPLDYSSWRQVDTDSIARNFLEYKFNILYPQLNYDGPMPNIVQLEFQITTFIIAVIYSVFGYNIVLARMVPVLFFMGSCVYLYLLVKSKSGINAALFTVLIYGILPINVVYSRNIMPESALMFFMIGGLYYFDRWIESSKLYYYVLSLLFTTLTILTKLPSALIGIPMIYMVFSKFGYRAFRKADLYIFAILTLGIPAFYMKWLGSISEQRFVSGIGLNMILPNMKKCILTKETAKYLSEQFAAKVFTIPGAVLFSAGIVIKKRREEYLYYAWLFACAVHIIFVDAAIHLDYYLMFITPVISIFMGIAAMNIIHNKKTANYIYASIILILFNDLVFMKVAYRVQDKYITIGEHVSEFASKGDLVIIGQDSPEIFYTSDRKGWRLYGNLLTADNIKKLEGSGARYFIPASLEIDSGIKEFLDKEYTRIDFTDGYFIYSLK